MRLRTPCQLRYVWATAATSAVLAAAGCNGPGAAGDAGVDYNAAARPVARVAPGPDARPARDVQRGSGGSGSGGLGNGPVTTGGSAPPPAAKSYDEMPAPPAQARYTIYCQAYSGPDHQDVARRARDFLRANTSLSKWYVVHGPQQSTLYYGFYRTTDRHDPADAAEGERALADLDAVRTLHDSAGVRLFAQSLPVPIDSPDPTADPRWDITRTGGYWSLEVAVFKDTADRKRRAVEAVAEARRTGYDAYYYHGPHASSVCIGSWPKASAAELSIADQNVDPDKPLLVTPGAVDPAYQKQLGDNVQTATPQVDPVDPTLIAAMHQWTEHSVNGYTLMHPVANPAPGQPAAVAERPFLFKVPHGPADDDGVLPSVDTAAADQPMLAPAGPAPAAPGTAGLKSLGD